MLSTFENSDRTILTSTVSMYLFLKHREEEAWTPHVYFIIFQHAELLPCTGKLTNTSNENSQNTIIILCGRKNMLVKMVITMTFLKYTSLFGMVTVA